MKRLKRAKGRRKLSALAKKAQYHRYRRTAERTAVSHAVTESAHGVQKQECPQGTSATPERGASKHTSQVSAESCWGADVDGSCVSSTSSLSLLSDSTSCSASVCVTAWLTARRNCIRVYCPASYFAMPVDVPRSSAALFCEDGGWQARCPDAVCPACVSCCALEMTQKWK